MTRKVSGWDFFGWKQRKDNPVKVRCQRCNKQYTTPAPHKAKYCSTRCRDAAARERKGQQPKQYRVRCGQCGRTFTAVKANAMYCSPRCRQRASRETRKKLGR